VALGRWLFREDKGGARPYGPGDRPAVGAEVRPGREHNDAVLWIESHRCVLATHGGATDRAALERALS